MSRLVPKNLLAGIALTGALASTGFGMANTFEIAGQEMARAFNENPDAPIEGAPYAERNACLGGGIILLATSYWLRASYVSSKNGKLLNEELTPQSVSIELAGAGDPLAEIIRIDTHPDFRAQKPTDNPGPDNLQAG